jgi:c-di-GMP-related signal transduction protein
LLPSIRHFTLAVSGFLHSADKQIVNNPSSGNGAAPAKRGIPLRYVARQPIFDRHEKVFGYELLFRDGLENTFSRADADMASRSMLDSSLLIGLDVLCDGRRAFVSCTRDTLIKRLVTLLPAASTVVEIAAGVPADPDVIAACRRLQEDGYTIALEDFVEEDPREPLVELADILKVELRAATGTQRAALLKRYGSERCRMLAEKVETHEQFAETRDKGFTYFQGNFFRKPEMVAARDIPANGLNYLRMLKAVSRPDLDVVGLENLIKTDASTCYRLLRYLNSAAFGFKSEIQSVRHALTILGEREVRRWVRLVAAVSAGEEKPSDLVLSALVRARFCELLTPKLPHGDSDLFLMGLLSMIDAMLDVPMAEALEKLSVSPETRSALLGEASVLRPVYQLMLAHESGEWEAAAQLSENLHLNSEELAGFYWQAQQWARAVSTGE